MSNIRDTDLLLVNRSGSSYQCSKANIGNVRDSDIFLVNRDGVSYQCSKANVATNVRDSDRVLISRSGSSYQATGADFKSIFSLTPGDPYEGGYFAGQINDGGTIYNLVIAPVTANGVNGQYNGFNAQGLQWKGSHSNDGGVYLNDVYGRPATEAATTQHSAMYWIRTGVDGPNAGTYDTSNSAGTGIGGFNDWYMPAANELQIAYFFLKPGTQANTTTKGNIATSVDPYLPFTRYGPGYPNQTINPAFHEGQSEAFKTTDWYWSASEWSAGDAYIHRFSDGMYQQQTKTAPRLVRAIRRVPA